MAISSHEMYLILKVRDEGSRILRAFGGEFSTLEGKAMKAAQKQLMAGVALTTLGVGIGAVGAAGIMFFNDAVDASIEYTEASARTLTQVDKLGVSLGDVADMGRRVANEVPVAFESIQAGLYDIFSSMEVSMPEAESLLFALSKAAVAGSVDVSTAARATIGILNAYKLPASEVNSVNDVMFQLVRKGIGTYKEFTSTIGRSIPSAVKAGQSYKDVAGMLAFLTRNNMSAAMSSSSAARAMDAISKPKSIANLKEMGVNVADASGKFRPMVDIMTDLRGKLAGLTPVAKAAKLDAIFKGSGGTIQAMRFFNLATGKAGPLLNTMTTAMNKAGGAADEAYKIMAATPAAKLELLNNRYKSMKTVVGEQLLPVKMKLVEALSKLLDWWNNLSPGMQKAIVIFLAVGAAVTLLIGIIMVVAGIFLMMSAAAAMASMALLPVIGIAAAIVIGLMLLVAAIAAVIIYWDEIKAWTISTWNTILNWLSQTWDTIKQKAIDVFNGIKDWLSSTWDSITSSVYGAWSGVLSWLSTTWDSIKNKVVEVFTGIKDFFVDVWDSIASSVSSAWNAVGAAVSAGMAWVGGVIRAGVNLLLTPWRVAWGFFGPLVKAAWGMITAAVRLGIAAVKFIVAWGVVGIKTLWIVTWTAIKTFFVGIWNGIYNFVAPKVTALKNFVSSNWTATKANAVMIWTAVKDFFVGIWNAIYSFVAGKVTALKDWVTSGFNSAKSSTTSIWNSIYSAVSSKISAAYNAVSSKVNAIKSYVSGAWNTVKSLTSAGWSAVVSAISTKINDAMAKVSAIKGRVTGYLSGAAGWLRDAGYKIISGLVQGITDAFHLVTEKMDAVTGWIADHMPGSPVKKGKLKVLNNGYAGKQIMTMLAAGMKQTNPVKAAMDNLTHLITTRVKALGDKGIAVSGAAVIKKAAAITAKLNVVAKQREVVAVRLKAAQEKLTEALKLRDDYAKAIRESMDAYADVTSTKVEDDKVLTAADIIRDLGNKLEAVRTYTINLAKLKAMGLNDIAYKQLVDAGVEAGGATAAALVSGSAGTISTINALQKEIVAQGATLATAASKALYQAGVDAAAGLVKGLAAQSTALAAAATVLAKSLVAAVKKALGIKSPSSVMFGIGGDTVDGLLNRLYQDKGKVADAMSALVKVPQPGSLDFASSAARRNAVAGLSASGTTGVTQHFEINTQEIDPKKHAADLGFEIARRGGY